VVAEVPQCAIFTHNDLDAIFLNIDLISKVNDKFLEDLEAEWEANAPEVRFADIFKRAARQFKGCYTRYVNNYDSSEAKLRKIRESSDAGDREKQRYLTKQISNPDANGKDVTSFLIQPVQRVLRYRLLLTDLLEHTDPGHPDEEPVREALEKICELAKAFNEDKRFTDDFAKLRTVFSKFVESDAVTLRAELLSYERKLLKEGLLVKARLSHRQRRQVFLFNDLLIYAAPTLKGCLRKGTIKLHDGARVESLPKTEEMPHAFAIVEKGGKGYTWLAESEQEKLEWFKAIGDAISAGKQQSGVGPSSRAATLLDVPTKPLGVRIQAVKAGNVLTKYNKRDGKHALRWVYVSPAADKILWGDQKTRECKSEAKLSDATALLHGAKGSAFFKQQGSRRDEDWQCFSIVFKERTLDFAATNGPILLDWYLALAALIPKSTETLLDEAALRERICSMMS